MSLMDGSPDGGTPAGDKAAGQDAAKAGAVVDWTADMTPELKTHIATKGYKSPADVVTAHMHAEKLIGADKIVLPKDGQWDDAARLKLGIPKDPDGYQIKKPDLPQGMVWDENFEKTAKAFAHKHAILPSTMQELVSLYAAQRSAEYSAQGAARDGSQTEAAEALQAEWGKVYNTKLDFASKAAHHLGGQPLIDFLAESGAGNNVELIKAFSKVGEMLGEDTLKVGKPAGMGLTPDEARAEANKLMAGEAYRLKTHPEHDQIVQKVAKLFEEAYNVA